MTSRRDNRDRDDRRRDPGPGREPTGSTRSNRPKLNEFFVNGEGIHREVLQREICKYLGPEAYSRPHSYNGIQGYLVSAIRPFTPDQLDDLQELSEAYILEDRERRQRGHQGITYRESETSRRQDASSHLRHTGSADMLEDPYYSPQSQYSMANTQQGYPALTSSYAQTQGGTYASAYPPDPGYSVGSGYATGYPSGSARPNDNYSYGNESPRNDPYRQPGFSGAQRPQPSRVQDPRDPRQDPRFAPPGRDARMDPRAMQQPQPGYSYTTAGDVGPGYAYVPPPSQSGRGMEPYPQPRAPIYGDPYRSEPIRDNVREERPRRR